MAKNWLVLSCLLGFFYVALGAFGAHALKDLIAPEKMVTLGIANQYLGFHALALGLFGLWSQIHSKVSGRGVGLCFLAGIALFSGSLYVYVLLGQKWAAMITPLGGSLFLVGWVLFLLSVVKNHRP